jgi:membrane dipeptidase
VQLVPTLPALPILDGHNDTLLKLRTAADPEDGSFFVRRPKGHIDLPRAREGHFAGGLFAIFVNGVEPENKDPDAIAAMMRRRPELGYSQHVAISTLGILYRLEAESDGQVQIVRTADQLSACLGEGVLAAVAHFEGAEPIDPQLDSLPVYYEAGLRSVGLVWSRPNAFGEGVPFGFPQSPDTGPGLTDAGKALVRACNDLGIVIDVSHLNEQGFWDVARISEDPLVATHSGVHALCPSSRNLLDTQLEAIAESGGLVGINFHVGFLRADGKDDSDTPIREIVRHVDYVAERFGIEHVAFGSDFDGATMPQELGDVAGFPKLIAALRADGFGDEDLVKITHENWQRVLRQTWA